MPGAPHLRTHPGWFTAHLTLASYSVCEQSQGSASEMILSAVVHFMLYFQQQIISHAGVGAAQHSGLQLQQAAQNPGLQRPRCAHSVHAVFDNVLK